MAPQAPLNTNATLRTLVIVFGALFVLLVFILTLFISQNEVWNDAGIRHWLDPSMGIYLSIGAILVSLALAWATLREIRRAVSDSDERSRRNQQAILRLLDEMSSLADGNLTLEMTVTDDITGAIADSVNYAIEALRELVVTINETAVRVASSAENSQKSVATLTQSSEKQTRQIRSASTAIGEMTSSIRQVSGKAEHSSLVAQKSVSIAHNGIRAARRTIEGMDSIREQIQETSKRIKRLGESSQEIGNIVELINDITEQTNILALNAAIQASLAGEAGRGFAVVADEVQRLAVRSSNATRQIEALVTTIQADTNEAIQSMEKSTSGVVEGAKLAENAGSALDEIEQVSNQIAEVVQSIAGASKKQVAAANRVSVTMDAIQDITSRTSESTQATTQAVTNLGELSGELRKSVSGFTLPDDSFRATQPQWSRNIEPQ